jgi:hypothetical protein
MVAPRVGEEIVIARFAKPEQTHGRAGRLEGLVR